MTSISANDARQPGKIQAGILIFAFLLVERTSYARQLMFATLAMSIGFFGMWKASDYTLMTISGAINGIGAGILLVSSVAFSVRLFPKRSRGRGMGTFQSFNQLGFFLSALVVIGMLGWLNTRAEVVKAMAIALLVAAVLAMLVSLLYKENQFADKATN
jgi:MFS family permease